MARVTVTATGRQGDRVTITDDHGAFTFPFLTPGRYTVRADLSGFSPLMQEGVEVRAVDRRVINVITKSGSNLVGGSAFGYTRPDALEADYTQLQTPNGTVNTTARS